MPLGIYFFAYFTSIIFNDKRGGLLMLGMFLNDLVGFFKRYRFNKFYENCGIFKSNDSSTFEPEQTHRNNKFLFINILFRNV